MHATLIATPFHREGWVYEEKVDGYRMLAYKDGDRVQLISRQGKDHTRRFPELAEAIKTLRFRTLVLDGEVAVYDERLISRFEWLRQRPTVSVATPPMFMAFDCLRLDEGDLRSQVLRVRRQRLEYVLDRAPAMLLPVRRLSVTGTRPGGKWWSMAMKGLSPKIPSRPTAVAAP
jgi:bifunctional non-homologous end joining protein LigD